MEQAENLSFTAQTQLIYSKTDYLQVMEKQFMQKLQHIN